MTKQQLPKGDIACGIITKNTGTHIFNHVLLVEEYWIHCMSEMSWEKNLALKLPRMPTYEPNKEKVVFFIKKKRKKYFYFIYCKGEYDNTLK